jgi:hypothetical protein
MQRSLVVGLAFVIAAPTSSVRADPSVPQVDPIHLQREDAQRVREQQRELDRDRPAPAAAPVPLAPIPPDLPSSHNTRAAGVVLLGVAGVSALFAVPFGFVAAIPGETQGTYETFEKIFLVTTAAAGITGVVLIVTSRSAVQLAPTATPTSVGLAIMGRL